MNTGYPHLCQCFSAFTLLIYSLTILNLLGLFGALSFRGLSEGGGKANSGYLLLYASSLSSYFTPFTVTL